MQLLVRQSFTGEPTARQRGAVQKWSCSQLMAAQALSRDLANK